MALDGNENIYILGHTLSQDADISSPIGNADIWLVKLNQGGELLHELTYGGTSFDLGRDLIFDQQQRLWYAATVGAMMSISKPMRAIMMDF